jgi:hypothetical protein
MHTLRVILLASLMTGALMAPASRAYAQAVPGKEVAKKLFEEGADLEKNGDYVSALAKYKEAEKITVTPGLRFHKGYCLEMTGKLSAALLEYEAADKLAREANKPEVHAAVIARLDPLRTRIPQIAIRLATVAKDAEVQLDGEPVAAALLDGKAFRLDPGEHAVTARAAGYRNFVRRVQVPESMTTTVDVVLDHAPAAAVVPPPAAVAAPAAALTEPPSESAARRSLVLPIATTAGAVVLAGTGVVFVIVAGGAAKDAKADCLQKTSCDSEQSKVRTFDALALGSFIGAAGLGALSAVLWTSKGGNRGAAIVAHPAFAGGSVGLEGSF